MARGVLVDGQRVKDLRRARALSAEQLADDTELALRTISRIEAGGPVSIHTLGIVAAELGVEPHTLFPPEPPEEPEVPAQVELPPPVGDLVQLSLTINATIERYSLSHVRRLLHEMAEQLRQYEVPRGVEPIDVRGGSVIVELQMTYAQAHAIIDAFKNDSLATAGVTYIDITDWDRSEEYGDAIYGLAEALDHVSQPRAAQDVTPISQAE